MKRLVASDFVRARRRLLQMHYESGVGHIGGNLSALDVLLIVFHEYLTERDCFILSKGHSAGALYTTLWSAGRLTDEDLRTFHRDDTQLAGHTTPGLPGIVFATGSLGHGLPLAAGTALGFRFKGRDGHVWCLTSDGEWQEGSTWEGLIFARHHGLTQFTVLVDHNELQGFGRTSEVATMSELWTKLEAFGVDVEVVDGHDPDAIRACLDRSIAGPRVVVLRTVKGRGVSFMENRMEWHYLSMDERQYRSALEEIGQA